MPSVGGKKQRVRTRGGRNSQEAWKVQRGLRKEKTSKEGLGGHWLKEDRKEK